MATDILLDENDDLRIENGDFVVGDSIDQEVGLLIRLSKGGLKEDPILGCDLIRLMHGNITDAEVKQIIKVQLARDGKSYDELKERIGLRTQ